MADTLQYSWSHVQPRRGSDHFQLVYVLAALEPVRTSRVLTGPPGAGTAAHAEQRRASGLVQPTQYWSCVLLRRDVVTLKVIVRADALQVAAIAPTVMPSAAPQRPPVTSAPAMAPW